MNSEGAGTIFLGASTLPLRSSFCSSLVAESPQSPQTYLITFLSPLISAIFDMGPTWLPHTLMQEVLLVEVGCLWYHKKSIFRDPQGRMRSGGNVYLCGNKTALRFPISHLCEWKKSNLPSLCLEIGPVSRHFVPY